MTARQKLTPAALDVLRSVKAGTVYRSESIGTLYESFRRSDHWKVTRWVHMLSDRALIRIGDQTGITRPWHITEAGETELAATEQKRPRTGGRLKAYTLGNSGFVRSQIAEATGSRHTQVEVVIIASTKAEAARLADEYAGARVPLSNREFRVADGWPFADSLRYHTTGPAVYVTRMTARPGDPVLACDATGFRRVGTVGNIPGSYSQKFIPDTTPKE